MALERTIDALITAEMLACIGMEQPARELPEEISASDVRRFVEVVGETNALYRDAEFARHFAFDGQVVPPMLVVQLYRRIDAGGDADAPDFAQWPGLQLPPNYTNTRNAGHEFTWLLPVYVGDRLTLQRRLVDIFVRVGRRDVPVIYLVSETEIRNQHGQPVLRQRSTTAKMPATAVAEGQ